MLPMHPICQTLISVLNCKDRLISILCVSCSSRWFSCIHFHSQNSALSLLILIKSALMLWILICFIYVKYPQRISKKHNLTEIKALADIQVKFDLKWQTVDHKTWVWLQPFGVVNGFQIQILFMLWSSNKLLHMSK